MSFTKYIDVNTTLNPHLHAGRERESSPVATQIVSVARNPPRITNDEDIIRANLKRVFGFTDELYAPHQIYFPNQVSVIRTPTLLSRQLILDVNYRWCAEYFHFLTEVLPNVLFLREQYPTAPVFCSKGAFTEGMFRWFGVQTPIIDQKMPIAKRAEAVFVQCGNPSRESMNRIRSVVESKLTFEKTMGILIRRHKTRFVENEDELFEECKARFPNLTWNVFDHLPPADTATLFSKAGVIVAPHGAGLTNMIFSSKGIAVYEFMPVDEPNICYWHLSELLGNSYTMIPTACDPATRSMKCKIPEVL